MTKTPGETIVIGPDTRFSNWGYAVYRLNLTQPTIEKLKKIAGERKTNAIFNQQVAPNGTQEAKDNDKKRHMSKPFTNTNIKTMSGLQDLWNELTTIGELHNRAWKPFNLVVLRSEAGCLRQEIHTDGTGDDPEIGGVLIAVEDETFFDINQTKLELRAGEAVAFHGNTPHNGAQYAKNNVRFHVYLAKEKNDLPTDEVGKFYRICDKCHMGFMTPKDKKNHFCHARPVEEIKAKRERNKQAKRRKKVKEQDRKNVCKLKQDGCEIERLPV
jgi:hypothetical protein